MALSNSKDLVAVRASDCYNADLSNNYKKKKFSCFNTYLCIFARVIKMAKMPSQINED